MSNNARSRTHGLSGFSAEENGEGRALSGRIPIRYNPAVAQRWKRPGSHRKKQRDGSNIKLFLKRPVPGGEFSPEEYEQWRDITPDSAVLWAGFSPEQTGAIFKYGLKVLPRMNTPSANTQGLGVAR